MINANVDSAEKTRAPQTLDSMSTARARRWSRIAQNCSRAVMLLLALLSLASAPASAVTPAERQALLDLYNSTHGATWTNSTNWNGGTGTECTWFGVLCSMITSGNVISVSLPNNNLTGTLPTTVPGLSALDQINVIELPGNHIGGAIPSLAAFLQMNTIDLSNNQLTGSIPQLSTLPLLGAVSFADNQLTGSIPSLTGLTLLRAFDVSDNQLTGSIPSLTGLTALVGFSVKNNALTGSLPDLTGLTLLQTFFAYQNQLTGSIPNLSGLSSIQTFYVYSNQLTGPVPSVAGLTTLVSFAAYSNQLDGTIGSLTGASNLALYLLYQNQLTGSIPSLAGLTNLQFFQVENNQLTGGLPSLIGLNNLLFFQAENNQLSGSIPPLTGLTGLVRYTASNNQLTGTLPSLAGLDALGYFLVFKNQLTGTMPSLTGLNNLIDIEVAENLLTGALPPVSALPNLQQLIVSGNQFSGPIPAPPPSVIANGSDLRYNALVPDGNSTDTAIWNAAQDRGNDWQATQTVAPGGVTALASGTAVTVSWTPIAYTGDTGAYEVYKSTTPGGPYTLAVSTANKSASSANVPGLSAMTTYYFVVATRTDAHIINPDPQFTNNANIVRSANSAEVSATTTNPLSGTTTTLTSSGSPSSLGTAVTFTATVTGGTNPTGNVIFRDASSIFATMPLQLVGANYQATYTIANLATSTHPFTAQYVGDTSNSGSTSAILNQVVGPAATTFSGTTATGTGPASAAFTGGGSDCGFEGNQTAFVVAPPSLPVPGATLPHGVFKFKLVNCEVIFPIHMSVTWPSLAGMTYYKYGPINVSSGNSVWYQPDNLVITGNTATYEVMDGFLGDDDLQTNGEIVDPSGPVVVPAGPPGTSVSSEISNTFAGSTCSRTATNGFKCWGLNSNKELGDNTTTPHTSPVDVQNVPANTAVIQGVRNGTCLFSNTGALKCFGYNGDGEIGNNTQSGTPTGTPTDVTGLSSGVAQVGSTASGRCALTTAGGVKCWGRDLDQSTIVYHLTPVDVPGLTSGVVQIAGGYDFVCALTVSGGVKCWGANSRNQLGDGSNMDRFTPGDVSGLTSGVAFIAAGSQHACALLTTGGLKCWGYNSNGQVGDGGSTATNRSTPVDVSGLTSGVVNVAGGFSHTCAVLASGAVNCWGFNLFGQVGDSSFTQRLTPVQVTGLTSGYVAVVGGGNVSCAQSSNGAVKCWGNNDSSNGLGDGTNNTSATPVNVVGLGGGNHVLSAFTPPAAPSFPLTRGVGQSLTLSATSSAGLPVTFSTYTPDRCTVTGNQVQFIAVGLCFVRASSAANGTFSEASDLTREILVTAGGPAISLNPTTLPVGVAGTAYSQNVTAIGGLGPYTFTTPPGTLPPGLSLASFGTLTGTPTGNGSFAFTVTATDSTSATGAQAYTIVIAGGPTITISPATLPSGAVGTAYSQTLTASGGTAPYAFTVPPNTLPTGLSLASSGALTGVPTANGSFTFTVTATDFTSATGTQSYTVVIGAGPTITISPATLPAGTVGTAYSQTLTASGGSGPYTFTVPPNTLPTGLSLAVSGAITGNPTANGNFTFTVTATDSNSATGTRTYTVVIAAITRTLTATKTGTGSGTVSSAPPGIQCGATCSASFADGASVTLTAVASAGSSFVGWSGACTGTGACIVTMTTAQSVTAQFNALPVPLSLPPATLPVGALNVSYPFTFAAIGGTQPYSYALSGGALPPGLGLGSTTGALTGIPTQIGTYSFQITVTDALSATATQSYSVTVSAIAASIPTVSGGALWAMMLLTLALGVVMLRRRSR